MECLKYLLFCSIFNGIFGGYPPTGDEVQPGSVLLPATRRGRYLANIVRRQAVDGTGIKFNKDADRMNAEAKKKVDVLSEELLPYIIAEQERRTTLYKRVLTALQNGEKGVTVAEIRNKPPLIIRKGLLYRCPSNRAPKEPDGSGVLMCEGDIEPTQVMFDSCLSAEDKELYVAENKYFFCNRHKIEGPDLPRNGSTVIGCAPIERTSLNYTSNVCALEDTDDVVVHYRYYPDRTYKFVTELDPDREVCDHWRPCQIGYIYSLPGPDQALPANELWHDYTEKTEEYERDEIVPPIPEDSLEEFVPANAKSYRTSPRRVAVPAGHTYRAVVHKKMHTGAFEALPDSAVSMSEVPPRQGSRRTLGLWLQLSLTLDPWLPSLAGAYFVQFVMGGKFKYKKLCVLTPSALMVAPQSVELLLGQRPNATAVPFQCRRCRLLHVLVRAGDWNVYNLDGARYRVTDYRDRDGKPQQYLEMKFQGMQPQDFGDYFAVIQNGDGQEERIKVATATSPGKDTGNAVQLTPLVGSYEVGSRVEQTVGYSCSGCELVAVLCGGDSVLGGRVTAAPAASLVGFHIPRFENSLACVYMGFFKLQQKVYRKVLAVIDNSSPAVTISETPVVPSPQPGEQFEHTVRFSCDGCTVEKVHVNGVPVESVHSGRRSSVGSIAFYEASPSEITIRITEFSDTWEGVYQAEFLAGSEPVTKTIMEIRPPDESGSAPAAPEGTSAAPADVTAATEGNAGASTAAPVEGSTAAEGDAAASTAAPEDGSTAAAGDAAASTAVAEGATAATEAPV